MSFAVFKMVRALHQNNYTEMTWMTFSYNSLGAQTHSQAQATLSTLHLTPSSFAERTGVRDKKAATGSSSNSSPSILWKMSAPSPKKWSHGYWCMGSNFIVFFINIWKVWTSQALHRQTKSMKQPWNGARVMTSSNVIYLLLQRWNDLKVNVQHLHVLSTQRLNLFQYLSSHWLNEVFQWRVFSCVWSSYQNIFLQKWVTFMFYTGSRE